MLIDIIFYKIVMSNNEAKETVSKRCRSPFCLSSFYKSTILSFICLNLFFN